MQGARWENRSPGAGVLGLYDWDSSGRWALTCLGRYQELREGFGIRAGDPLVGGFDDDMRDDPGCKVPLGSGAIVNAHLSFDV